MALVAYEYSDSSDAGSEDEDDKQTDKSSVVVLIPQTNVAGSSSSGLFSTLPEPKKPSANDIIEEEEDEILLKHKNSLENNPPPLTKSSKVKITIPSLNSYKSDEEDDVPKKIIHKAPEKATGLFAILPSPKCPAPENRKFDATIVKQKNLVPRTVKANQQKKAAKRAVESDEEDIPTGSNFFSSIFTDNKINAAPSAQSTTLNIQVDSAQHVRDINSKSNNYFASLVAEATKKPEPEPEPEPEETPEEFEKKAVKELCGKKHKRMKGEDIQMIDINATDIMPDPRDWRTKALTEEDHTPAVKKGEEPSVQSKRKHQITYLAYQAKVNEQELKNQWALNRMTRKQTQAKYGF